MKKLILLSILTLGIFTISHAQEYGWMNISNNVPGDSLYHDLSDVFFISEDEGWITSSSHAEIYHTIDGGLTFDVQTTQLTTNAIYMLNANEGYCGGASGFIYRTTDGGDNWIFHATITSTLSDIAFPPQPADTGYACGDNGKIFKVFSTGMISMMSNIGSTNLASIIFPSPEEGWSCGEQVIVHYSTDSWDTDQSLPFAGYNAIYFTNNFSGWAVGDNGIIIFTSDGQNWTTQNNLNNNSLFDVFFLTQNDGWAIGVNGTILQTIDGGTNWNIEGAGLSTAFLRGVHFTSTTNGYVVGNLKTLLKYTEISGIGNAVEHLRFEINPNPTQNIIQIKCSAFKTESGIIEILSLDGKKILETEIETGIENIELDLNNLKSGMYLCKLSTDKKSSTKKLIIE